MMEGCGKENIIFLCITSSLSQTAIKVSSKPPSDICMTFSGILRIKQKIDALFSLAKQSEKLHSPFEHCVNLKGEVINNVCPFK